MTESFLVGSPMLSMSRASTEDTWNKSDNESVGIFAKTPHRVRLSQTVVGLITGIVILYIQIFITPAPIFA